MLADRTDKCRDDDLHVGQLFAFFRLLADVAGQQFKIHLMLQKNLCVHTLGHQVWSHGNDGIRALDSPAVMTVAKQLQPFFLCFLRRPDDADE